MLTRFICVVLALGLTAAVGLPQDAQNVGKLNDTPFEGEVTASHLNIRIFPKVDPSSTIIAVLKKGTKVKVVEKRDGWYGIQPPKKAWVWVWGRNFKISADGATAIRDCTMRADSRVNSHKLGTMNAGTTVKIQRQHLGWFRVNAPESLLLWASAKYIKFLSEAAPVEAARKVEAAKDVAARAKIEEAERMIGVQDELLKAEKFNELNYQPIIAIFREARDLADTDDMRDYADRQARRFVELQTHKEAMLKAGKVSEQVINDLKDKLDSIPAPIPEKTFAFVGSVGVTGRFLRNRPGTHKLFDDKGEIVCFVKVKDGDQNMLWALNGFYEKQVGVNGTVIHDPEGWAGYSVIIVDEVEPIITEDEMNSEEMKEDF